VSLGDIGDAVSDFSAASRLDELQLVVGSREISVQVSFCTYAIPRAMRNVITVELKNWAGGSGAASRSTGAGTYRADAE
jgi:hypothetical protein